jgi:SCP-2 sterol transfer family
MTTEVVSTSRGGPLMSNPTVEFFQNLSARGSEPSLANFTGTLRFDVTEDGRAEQWWVRIDRGVVRVSTGGAGTDPERADCVMETARTVFDRIVTGEVNAMAALLRGDLVAEGDPELLVAFQRLFPTGPKATAGAPAEVVGGRVS